MSEPLLPDWAHSGYRFTYSCISRWPNHAKCSHPKCDCHCHKRGDGASDRAGVLAPAPEREGAMALEVPS